MFTSIINKIHEYDQNHFENEKVLDQTVNDLGVKLDNIMKKQDEEKVEESVESLKCRECSLTFNNIKNLKKHMCSRHSTL